MPFYKSMDSYRNFVTVLWNDIDDYYGEDSLVECHDYVLKRIMTNFRTIAEYLPTDWKMDTIADLKSFI